MDRHAIARAAGLLRAARRVVALTGAGISRPSGIPDFRSAGGLWTRDDPLAVASLAGFRADPRRFYSWVRPLIDTIEVALPNPAHLALAQLEREGRLSAVITQNIDGLHKIAGTSEAKLVELHGSDRLVTCLKCGKTYQPAGVYEKWHEKLPTPTCDDCGGFLKSANVSFGQSMPVEAMQRAQSWSEQADIFVVIGSSLQVQPAASFPVIAKRSGALLAIVNRDPTPLDDLADFVHNGAIGEFFSRLRALSLDS